jgi:hypothetical protein
MSNKTRELYEFGPFRMDPYQRLLLRENRPVALQPKAFETHITLVRNSEQVVLKEDLMKSVWPDSFIEESEHPSVGDPKDITGESNRALHLPALSLIRQTEWRADKHCKCRIVLRRLRQPDTRRLSGERSGS